MIRDAAADRVLARLDSLAGAGRAAFAEDAMGVLAEELDHFDWVGVYWIDGDELRLGPYVGAPTEHDRIPVGRGVCGTAVAENANQVIPDVRELENYLACSAATRSEIVVLIRDAAGAVLGQIDVDGHAVGAFDESDERLLAAVAARIAERGP